MKQWDIHMQKRNLDNCIPFTKTQMGHRSRCKIQSYKTPRTQKKIQRTLYVTDFLGTMSKAQSTKEITDKIDFIKIKSFFFAKDNVKRRKQATEWEKYL